MSGAKRYSAWDIATLARADAGERALLLRETRFVPMSGWSPLFGRRYVCLFSSPRRRRWNLVREWLCTGATVGLVVLGVWDLGREDRAGHPGLVPLFVCIFVCTSLWTRWTYGDPRLIAVRRRRTSSAARVMGAIERGALDTGETSAVGEDVRLRRTAWLEGATRPKPGAIAWSYRPSATLMVAGLLAVAAGPYLYSAVGRRFVSPLLIPLLMVGALGGSRLIANHLLNRFARNMKSGACPDCGYDLSSVRSSLAPDLTSGVHVGPSRCTECGSPWPLIPPPLK